MKKMRISLAWQIVIALFLGILVGAFLHNSPELRNDIVANFLQPLGKIFINLIKMIVIPLVLSMLILGIANAGDSKSVGKLGLKTIIYFEIITTVAIIVGLVAANVFQPGAGIDMSTLTTSDISQYKETTQEVDHEGHGLIKIILSVIPPNIFAAMSDGHMLPVIFFAVIFGIGLGSLSKETKQPLIDVLKAVSETMFKVTHMIMMFAPFGVFGLIAATVANFGFSSLVPLIKLAVLVYAAILFFIFIVLGLVAKFCGFSVWTIIKILKDELILAYSTASSETVLPRMMEKMEAYGAPKSITSFVVPIGYSFNLDGSTLYQSIAAIFIAQLYGIDLTITQQILLVATLMVTSKGIAGVPGVSFVVLLATLHTVGIPLEGLAFIAGIDRILDMARTVLNVIGNALAVLVISKWEGKFDTEKQKSYNFDATY
ncbi:glutamate/aspartate:proton symporter GltP [Acinetobacter bereziniae]|uniref:Probable proton/glutamate-aspartate symporter n=1 Tax=Acinetobacter bereziniae TaxID=106648 RepID=A0A8I1DG31_ACIBZ|nr:MULTISPECIES: glutamate/aspartate:proton symporter GltP [Acinetobacter]MEC8125493.1 glutamate/aspartate:proton symporter GltP [Pseudomonadota bacterium]MBJ8420458.1 glutamate/aspartate:proton symporter GltP [Acinetobacter bereziniae]MCU4475409.1 glutamate/aspartate:proton symporter GltP [Acinetobacter bereziniae]MCU4543289.1 glutamate/aspartate:proton symporter GltP [Acinetobacter bereziniae]MCU4627310.1 glutamate/aspartate:proton symporter GltP [Acinetobacter bereziniae]